ncbi:MAG: hypothetical protein ACRDJL_01325 [Actinomycetota bacterium]
MSIELRNATDHELWMVGILDGSEEGVRFPRYAPSVSRGDEVVAGPPSPEDPLVAPLRAADFRRLAPGESFDPGDPSGDAAYMPLSTFANFRPPAPGRYRYGLVLSTESEAPERWLGRFNQDAERAAVLDLIQRVPRLTVTSNVLEIEVR